MLNKIMVIGNLGTDPDMKYTPNGNAITTFRLAVSRSYTDSSGERQQDTEWFSVTAWNKLAESTNQYLSKGQKVYVEGRIKSNTWTAADGTTRFNNEIVASQVLFLDRSGDKSEDDKSEDDPKAELKAVVPW